MIQDFHSDFVVTTSDATINDIDIRLNQVQDARGSSPTADWK
jgi:hypothetical protein